MSNLRWAFLLAVPLLAEHQIPPSPLNYRVGHDYVAGSNALLIRALDELVADRLSDGHPQSQGVRSGTRKNGSCRPRGQNEILRFARRH